MQIIIKKLCQDRGDPLRLLAPQFVSFSHVSNTSHECVWVYYSFARVYVGLNSRLQKKRC